jgi:hypothetical protein
LSTIPLKILNTIIFIWTKTTLFINNNI